MSWNLADFLIGNCVAIDLVRGALGRQGSIALDAYIARSGNTILQGGGKILNGKNITFIKLKM